MQLNAKYTKYRLLKMQMFVAVGIFSKLPMELRHLIFNYRILQNNCCQWLSIHHRVLPLITTQDVCIRFWHLFSTYFHLVFKMAQWGDKTGMITYDRLWKLRPRVVKWSIQSPTQRRWQSRYHFLLHVLPTSLPATWFAQGLWKRVGFIRSKEAINTVDGCEHMLISL